MRELPAQGRERPTLRVLSIAFALCISAVAIAADTSSVFERPPELERDVQFWIRVYTQVTTDQGFLHDVWNLGVVYEVMKFDPEISSSERARKIDAGKKHYRALLERFAAGDTQSLSEDEQRIFKAFGDAATSSTFREAENGVRFQLGQANRFKEGLNRAGIWETHIARVLTQRGIPAEIAALPHVESSFNPAAYSKVGAAGLWQFMPSTARRYMRVDTLVDERMDPFTATEGAANLMLYNYHLLGTWPLAITAWNHGPGGLLKAQTDLGTSKIATIVRRYNGATFGFASRNFYVAFLAALDVDRDPEKYFGMIPRQPDAESTTVELPDYIPMPVLVTAFKVDLGAMRSLNQALRPPIWNASRFVPRGYALRLPGVVTSTQINTALARISLNQRYLAQRGDDRYKVRRGDSLASIARGRGITVDRLMAVNGLGSSSAPKRGTVLKLPLPGTRAGAGAPAILAATNEAVTVADTKTDYVVRPGDTLSSISHQLGVSERDLKLANGLRDEDFVYPGQHLKFAPQQIAAASARLARSEPAVAPDSIPAAVASTTVANLPVQKPAVAAAVQPPPPAARPPAVAPPPVPAPGAAQAPPRVAASAPPAAREATRSVLPLERTTPDSAPLFPIKTSSTLEDPADYSVRRDQTIVVQAAETLGHYADWTDVTAGHLRTINKLRKGAFVNLGHRIKLDFSKSDVAQFEIKRRDYHKRMQDAYFATHRISGTENYAIKKGESLWTITQQRPELPVWLLRQYNPRVDFGDVRPGSTITLPRVEVANRQ